MNLVTRPSIVAETTADSVSRRLNDEEEHRSHG